MKKRPRKKASPPPGPLTSALRKAIEASGWTSAELAGRSGVTAAVISRFRRGERDVTLATADKFAKALNLRICAGQRRGRSIAPDEVSEDASE